MNSEEQAKLYHLRRELENDQRYKNFLESERIKAKTLADIREIAKDKYAYQEFLEEQKKIILKRDEQHHYHAVSKYLMMTKSKQEEEHQRNIEKLQEIEKRNLDRQLRAMRREDAAKEELHQQFKLELENAKNLRTRSFRMRA